MELLIHEEVLEEHPNGRNSENPPATVALREGSEEDQRPTTEYDQLRKFIEGHFAKQTALITDLRSQIENGNFRKSQVSQVGVLRPSTGEGAAGLNSWQLESMAKQKQTSGPGSVTNLTRPATLKRDASRSTSTVLRAGVSRNVSERSGTESRAVTREQTHKALAMLSKKSEFSASTPDDSDEQEQVSISNLRAWTQTLVNSDYFAYVVQCVIMLNLILLGLEVDLRSGGETWVSFQTINICIVSFFIMEVLLRTFALGCCDFFCGPERIWNLLDLMVVFISVVEAAMEIILQALVVEGDQNSSYIRALRLVRLARALRSVRVMRFMRYIAALRTIILSIVSTLSPLLWTLAILMLLFYLFAVVLTQMVTDYCRFELGASSNRECDPFLTKYWSSVTESMLTLFKCITGGVSWEEPLQPLRTVSFLAVGTMLLYVVITVLAVLNVVTGVFCHTAIESAKADKDVAIMKQMKQAEAQKAAFQQIFKEIDSDDSDFVTLQELQAALSQPSMNSLLQSMDISTQDVWTLFMVLDENRDGCVTIDEFVYSCLRMQGPAKGLHLARMSYENALMRDEITKLQSDMRTMEKSVRRTMNVPSFRAADPKDRLSTVSTATKQEFAEEESSFQASQEVRKLRTSS